MIDGPLGFAPSCDCHDIPKVWNKDKRWSTGGRWECAVNRRERQLHYWHKADGGYIVWRKRKLKDQRARILQQIAELS